MRRIVLEDFEHMSISSDPQRRMLNFVGRYAGRPCFTIPMLSDLCRSHADLALGRLEADFVLWEMDHPCVFGLGGDLSTFASLIRAGDLDRMRHYGKRAVDALYGNACLFPVHDVETVTVVHGDALGGGLEAVLTSTIIVAERNAKLGFPEIGFNFFPGMGALNFLAIRIGLAEAKRIVLNPRSYGAEEMHEMGVVDILAETGKGRVEALGYIDSRLDEPADERLARRAAAKARLPIYDELIDIVLSWADTGMSLERMDLKKIDRLVAAQDRLNAKAGLVA